MCRISGIIQKQFAEAKLQHHINAMNGCMRNGGPDGEGSFIDNSQSLAFGHRRLALLDLSAAGHQPMPNKTGSLQIIFNGEIYNYLEIRVELKRLGYSFISGTDTEVILHAYAEWGKLAFKKLNGMFSLAIYDKIAKEVILARDVIGIKPLYFHQNADGLVFASEVRAFEHSGLLFREDPNWKIYFLSFGFIPEPFTTLKDVFALKPGTVLVYNLEQQSTELFPFEEITFSEEISNKEQALHLINTGFENSVQRHLIADVPVGVFLSGGLDSSLIALVAAKHHQNIRTISVNFEDKNFDEAYFQKKVLNKGANTHVSTTITKQDYLASVSQIRIDLDQPSNDAINTWFISRCAKKAGLKAVLSGVGGDELFGGYPSFKRIKQLKSLRLLPLQIFQIGEHLGNDRLKKISFLTKESPVNDYLFLRGFYTPRAVSELIDASEEEVKKTLSKLESPVQQQLSNKNYTSYLEQHFYMRSQLLKDTDQMSMAHGVEIRLPFLDKQFVKLTAQLSSVIKYQKGKSILADAFPNLLPRSIEKRAKKGFTFPLQEWQKSNTDLLKFKTHPNRKIRSITNKTFNNRKHWSRLWVLSFLEKDLIKTRILFLTLKTFSLMGGIERMNRTLMKAGNDIKNDLSCSFMAMSIYDNPKDLNPAYIDANQFKSFSGSFIKFFWEIVLKGREYDQVILSHIHLSPAGLLLKYLYGSKIFLMAHGVEVWKKLTLMQVLLLKKADLILAVSNFTKEKIHQIHQIPLNNIQVFHNCLDPFIKPTTNFIKSLNKTPSVFTLCRISSSELYKGYYQVIAALAILDKENIVFHYRLGGKYEQEEYLKINAFIEKSNLTDKVELCGYIPDEELQAYFESSDLFILPSKKEGFGLVFTEAIVNGVPVIAGNKDGSVDALLNGKLGTLINPDSIVEIAEAIRVQLLFPETSEEREAKMKLALKHFDFPGYKKKLTKLLKK